MKNPIQKLFRRVMEGFSLIELLISVAILAVAIIALVGVFPQGINQVVMSGHISMMNHLGQSKLDELRGTAWNHKLLLEGMHPSTQIETNYPSCTGCDDAADVETNDNFSEIPSGYFRQWYVDASPDGIRKTVEVTVGYLMYDDAGNPIAAPTPDQERGPRAIHRRQSQFTAILTSP